MVPQSVLSVPQSIMAEAGLRRSEEPLRHYLCLRVIVDPLGFYAAEATEDEFQG